MKKEFFFDKESNEIIENCIRRHKEIKSEIYHRNESKQLKNSVELAENISDISINDIIKMLIAIKYDPDLRTMSISLSRRSQLFDKLILMKSNDKNPWVLRVHIYPVVDMREGFVTNLGTKADSESFVHFHRWQLTSKFITGGFLNSQYEVLKTGNLETSFQEYELVATKDAGAEGRKAVWRGVGYPQKKASDIYQQGDHVHYPIEIPHRVDTSAAGLFGKTITLAHTGESQKKTSTFYLKKESEGDVVDNLCYSEKEFDSAVDTTITTLQLILLNQELINFGFKRFGHANSLETELLPTIAMCELEENFKEKGDDSNLIADTINKHTDKMDKHSLKNLIARSQEVLMNQGLFKRTIADIHNPEMQEAIANRGNNQVPRHVLGQI
ncbi:uncharacterized protein RVIR1_01650 [Candidatus Rickettsiella viridis]|uniref:Uncharacterized protein n=1 Tax=Candidatus Rickettsiella viridis TaxID=676208 RepID=A0A2Z5V2L5_9COXI|nr:hypothetical protein [Candidatus Rickettsiella viridis]BBB14702.1 uncharacterized protein RVIR1_01650 [Candidatus Rickettsiella viridis]